MCLVKDRAVCGCHSGMREVLYWDCRFVISKRCHADDLVVSRVKVGAEPQRERDEGEGG